MAQAFLCLVPLLLSSCKGSQLSDQFFRGARRQEGLDSSSLYLWSRSPAIASGNTNILSTDSLDSLVTKDLMIFTNVVDIYDPIRSADIIMQYSHIDEDAPSFFKWAGRYVPWRNNPDFRVLFAYNELNQGVAYVDSLFSQEYMAELPTKLYAWREAVCTGNTRGSRTCDSAADLVAAPVLPLYVSVDNSNTPSGSNSAINDTKFCPYFDSEYGLSSLKACHGRDYDDDTSGTRTWAKDWHQGRTRRQISFYRDFEEPSFNLVDDGDVVIHELAHAFQAALRPELLESDQGDFPQLDAIVEGSADFFVAAYRRDDEILRYMMKNLYPLYPDEYVGTLEGAYRDPKNSVYFPDGYIYESPHDLGRVLAGAINDYRRVLQGEDITKLRLLVDIPGLEVSGAGKYGVEAWDMAAGVLFRAFYTLEEADEEITLNGFAGHLLVTCDALAALNADYCESAQLKLVLENRGLIADRYFTPANFTALDPTTQDIAASGGNRFLLLLGKSNVTGDKMNLRYGMNMGETLGWIPFMPNGSTRFANDDGVVNPCEAIVIFPNIANNTNSDVWKDLSGDRSAPGLNGAVAFEAFPGSVASYDTIPAGERGVDLSDLKWTLAANPLGFELFEHPTLGYIDPFYGVDSEDVRGLPILKAGETVGGVAANQDAGLYQVWQERAFDLPWTTKGAAKSSVGWLFKAPDEAADPEDLDEKSAIATFTISYSAYNTQTRHFVNSVRMFTDGVGASMPYTSISQSLRVVETDGGFCD